MERLWSLEEQFEDACARITANEKKLRNVSFRNWAMKKYGCHKLSDELFEVLGPMELGRNSLHTCKSLRGR